MTRTHVISDIHGCFTELKELLSLLGYNATQDKLIILGDLVDRGPDSKGVVSFLKDLQEQNPTNIIVVAGNHDEKHARFHQHLQQKRLNPTYKIPMELFSLEKYQVFDSFSEEELNWLLLLPKFHLEEDWLFVHGGLEGNRSLYEQKPHRLLHVRYVDPETGIMVPIDESYKPKKSNAVFWTTFLKKKNWNYNVVYGHTARLQPKIDIVNLTKKILVGIDTGCCYGNTLTALTIEFNEIKFTQVKAKGSYRKLLPSDGRSEQREKIYVPFTVNEPENEST